jgi:hypothetical protein
MAGIKKEGALSAFKLGALARGEGIGNNSRHKKRTRRTEMKLDQIQKVLDQGAGTTLDKLKAIAGAMSKANTD